MLKFKAQPEPLELLLLRVWEQKLVMLRVANWPSSRPLSSNVAVLKNEWPWKNRSREWP
jgi:hypothetical protein